MTDFDIERRARELGRAEGDSVDLEAMAERVVARLGAPERVLVPAPVRRVLAAAAAVAALVVGTALWRGVDDVDSAPAIAVMPVPIDDLEPEALAEVLDSLTWQVGTPAFAEPTLDDLDERQLRELLAVMEG